MRFAETSEIPLRQIFNDVGRAEPESAQYVSFTDVESAMYKRRRLSMPALPTSCYSALGIVRDTRYAHIDGGDFYRGFVDVGSDGIALVFASDQQLALMHSATGVFLTAPSK